MPAFRGRGAFAQQSANLVSKLFREAAVEVERQIRCLPTAPPRSRWRP